jgi:phosphoribosylamine--glycine ligase
LIVGSGGREHALAWRLVHDPVPAEVLVAPGNDGITRDARVIESGDDPESLIAACRRERVDLVVIGPEGPLADGLADRLAAAGLTVYGPSRAAARLESSKTHAKRIMRDAGVPTAASESVEAVGPANAALDRFGPPYIVKADGLAAGKGVCVTHDRAEAERFVRACLVEDRFGPAGRTVLIERHLAGEERSVMAVCDGERFVILPVARDYKRALDDDRGPNTGGMGAYAPAETDEGFEAAIGRRVIAPVLERLRAEAAPFRGTLYTGLMIVDGEPHVLEFNVRFGDPETQVVLPLIEGSFGTLLASAARGDLDAAAIRRAAGATVAVALVDEGYPDAPRGGGVIGGLEALAADPGLVVFHAAARRGADGWITRGGREAWIVARAGDRAAARARVYDAIDRLSGSGWRCRRDIAADGARGHLAVASSRAERSA